MGDRKQRLKGKANETVGRTKANVGYESGRGKTESHASSRKGGKKGGAASAARPAAARSASAKKAARTRARRKSGSSS